MPLDTASATPNDSPWPAWPYDPRPDRDPKRWPDWPMIKPGQPHFDLPHQQPGLLFPQPPGGEEWDDPYWYA